MNIGNLVSDFLYDQNEYIIWSLKSVFIYGVKEIVIASDQVIKLNLIINKVTINGNNLKINKRSENEILISGDIYEITK